MPDVETELGRFGRWLDTEIDVRVEDGAALALSAEPAVNSARRRGRLAAAIGVAVALAVGVLVVTSRGPFPLWRSVSTLYVRGERRSSRGARAESVGGYPC